MMDDIEIGRFIRQRRKDLNISLEQVASICGVSKSTASRWETGNINKIKRSHIYLLSEILHLSVEHILGIGENIPIEDAKVILARKKVTSKLELVRDEENLKQIEKFIDTFILINEIKANWKK